MLKVLFQARVDFFSKPGGDTVQALKYKEYLGRIGVVVDIIPRLEVNLDKYHIVHLFNIDRPLEVYPQLLRAKRQNKKVIISTIHHDNTWLDEYERKGRYGLLLYLNRVFRRIEKREFLKNVLRIIRYKLFNFDIIQHQISLSIRQQQIFILNNADAILALAQREVCSLNNDLVDVLPEKVFILPNGVDSEIAKSRIGQKKNSILCVGRIESRKNQIALIRALKNTKVPIFFVGKINPWHKGYYRRFLSLIAREDHIRFIPGLPYEKLMSFYSRARVHVLPSWFEVFPLVDLEAGALGCKVVTTERGYTPEWIPSETLALRPDNIGQIRSTILESLESQESSIEERILSEFTWDLIVPKLKNIYEQVLADDI